MSSILTKLNRKLLNQIGDRFSSENGPFWTKYTHRDYNSHNLPSFGWKIHISFRSWETDRFFAFILSLPSTSILKFKIPSNYEDIERLHQGKFGLQIIGKSATIYPCDVNQFTKLLEVFRQSKYSFNGPSVRNE